MTYINLKLLNIIGWDVAIEGTGLGLYNTKKLVDLHDEEIWLESEGRNKGTIFYFSIPKK
ncbi:MAG: ATP-binding protein [Promethearchaeota archaeon]